MRTCEVVRTGEVAKRSRRKGNGSFLSAGAPPSLDALSPQRTPSLQLQSGEHEPDRSSGSPALTRGTISTFWGVEAALEEFSLELIVTQNQINGDIYNNNFQFFGKLLLSNPDKKLVGSF